MAEPHTRAAAPVPPPSLAQLFVGFLMVALPAFGGVLPWAQRSLVEQRGWLTTDEFTEMLSLCQILPGPNIVNMAIAVGSRFRGLPGAAAALLGLLGVPVTIVIILGMLYERYGELPGFRGMLTGITAAAAGLIVAMTGKIALPLLQRHFAPTAVFALLAFIGVAVMRWPLHWVLLALAPVSIAVAWRGRF
jgi:chromate transporter